MNVRTRTLGFLLFLLLLGAAIVIAWLNETAGQIVVGVIAGIALRGWGNRMAEAFTRDSRHVGEYDRAARR